MNALSKATGGLIAAFIATASVAATAQAQVFHPNNTAVSGLESSGATITYDGAAFLACGDSTLDGTTGVDSSTLDVSLTFQNDCTALGGLPATVACTGTVRLTALSSTTDSGSVSLNAGFSCAITVPNLCTVTISGPQAAGTFLLDEGADELAFDWDGVTGTRTGSATCGTATGTASFPEVYDIAPATNFRIDP
jgi:hypothetical protein